MNNNCIICFLNLLKKLVVGQAIKNSDGRSQQDAFDKLNSITIKTQLAVQQPIFCLIILSLLSLLLAIFLCASTPPYDVIMLSGTITIIFATIDHHMMI